MNKFTIITTIIIIGLTIVDIYLAVLNHNNKDIVMVLKNLFKYDNDTIKNRTELFNGMLKTLNAHKKLSRTKIVLMNTFNPVGYFAVDYNIGVESAFIEAKHYLLSDTSNDYNTIYLCAEQGDELYKIYEKQIALCIENEKTYTYEEYITFFNIPVLVK